MIWIDSSFAIEWLAGTDRAAGTRLGEEPLRILPMQYAETVVFFLKQKWELPAIAKELTAVELQHPTVVDLQRASWMYLMARQRRRNKASLADALLAAVATAQRMPIATFDRDFADLGFRERRGLWYPDASA